MASRLSGGRLPSEAQAYSPQTREDKLIETYNALVVQKNDLMDRMKQVIERSDSLGRDQLSEQNQCREELQGQYVRLEELKLHINGVRLALIKEVDEKKLKPIQDSLFKT